MFNWLEKIRQKPASSKRLIAFAISLGITGVLFIVWLSVWLPTLFQTEDLNAKNKQFETPTSSFAGNFSTAWESIVSEFADLKNAVTNADMTSSAEYKAQDKTTTTPVVVATTTTESTDMSTTSGLKF